MLATFALIGAGVAAAGLAPSLPVLIVVMVALGVVEGVATTYLISWMQQRTDPGMQGRVMSLAMLSSVGLEPVAFAVAGAVAGHDLGLLFWGSAVAIELTALGANVLAISGDAAGARALMEKFAKNQKPEGSVTGAVTSITRSGGEALTIETTALSMLAWMREQRIWPNGLRYLWTDAFGLVLLGRPMVRC